MPQLSNRAQSLEPSVTLATNALVARLRQEGRRIINLSIGEPDFETPQDICETAIDFVRTHTARYTATDGIPELKEAILCKLQRDQQLTYTQSEIGVFSGVKNALYTFFQSILNPGDEVIVPAPYWVSYPAMVELAGAHARYIEAHHQQSFKINAAQLEAAITPKTRLFILNSPNNPSGQYYTDSELADLGSVLARHPHIWIASDDIYEYILWSNTPATAKFHNILNVCPNLKNQTVVFNGVSKAYAMTGWRIGYAAGPKAVLTAMNAIQSQNLGSSNTIAQVAAVCALKMDRSQLQWMYDAFHARHDQLYRSLSDIPGFQLVPAQGTFYLFPCVKDAMNHLKLKDDVAFCAHLLEHASVAGVPGTGFGMPGYVRFSYANSLDTLKEASEYIRKAVS